MALFVKTSELIAAQQENETLKARISQLEERASVSLLNDDLNRLRAQIPAVLAGPTE